MAFLIYLLLFYKMNKYNRDMKKNYLYCSLSLLALLLSSCGGGRGRTSKSTSQSSSGDYSLPQGELSFSEYKRIVLNAVEVEKAKMSKVTYNPGESQPISITTRYNDGYYQSYQDVSSMNLGYNEVSIYAYSTHNFEHNYYAYEVDGQITGSINEYVSTEEENDNYIFTFGYGQIGISPAAFIACYSGIGVAGLDQVEINEITASGNHLSFIMDNYANSEGMKLFINVDINSFGGFETVEMRFKNNEMYPENVLIRMSSEFETRDNPPQKLIDLFMLYN